MRQADVGTTITLHIKDDTDEEKYSQFLEEYTIKTIVKKYSDYVRYPIRMTVEKRRLKEGTEDEYETVKEDETLNSMIPLWKKNKKEIKPEEYEAFYKDKFMDYEKPLKVIHYKPRVRQHMTRFFSFRHTLRLIIIPRNTKRACSFTQKAF